MKYLLTSILIISILLAGIVSAGMIFNKSNRHFNIKNDFTHKIKIDRFQMARKLFNHHRINQIELNKLRNMKRINSNYFTKNSEGVIKFEN